MYFHEEIDPSIVINEAIEITKSFNNDHASKFVNGVLQGILDAKKSNHDFFFLLELFKLYERRLIVEQYLTVSQLTKYIARKFEYDPTLKEFTLKEKFLTITLEERGYINTLI